jgi:HD-GYP domain-containing protein (c-di-GMP phosphodiesterase class II)
MSRALLISDNIILNNLYALNLNAYVATNVVPKKDFVNALKTLHEDHEFVCVICLEKAISKDELKNLLLMTNDEDDPIPVIMVGTQNEVNKENFYSIPNQYSLQEIVRTVAKIQGITAQDMAKKEMPKFFPIPVALLREMDESNCEIFYRTEVNPFEFEYFKIIDVGQAFDDSMEKFVEEGTDFLFVDSMERLKFINQTSKYILKELSNGDMGTDDRVKVLSHGFDVVANELSENPEATQELQEISEACVENINRVIKEIPKLSSLLQTLLNSKADYIYIHSMLASYVAGHIIDNMDWGSKEQKEKCSFCLFFHDIFMLPIFKKYPHLDKEEDLLFSDELNDEEKNIVLEHARMAGELVRSFSRMPIGADMIIMQHHGTTSGKGFAMNFKDDISPLSKIVLIAEEMAYHLYTLKKTGQKFADHKEGIIKELREKFRMHTYKKMVNALESLEV